MKKYFKFFLFLLISIKGHGQINSSLDRLNNIPVKVETFNSFKIKLKNGRDTTIAGFIVFKNRAQHIQHYDVWGKLSYFPTNQAEEITAYTGEKIVPAIFHKKEWLFKTVEGKINLYSYKPTSKFSWSFIQKENREIKPFNNIILGEYLKDNPEAYKIYKKARLNKALGTGIGFIGLGMLIGGFIISANADDGSNSNEENANPGFPLAFSGVIVAGTGFIIAKTNKKIKAATEEYNK